MTFRVFEHTADIGIEIEAPDLPGLFVESAHALFSVIRGDSVVRDLEQRMVHVTADRLDRALVDWLEEFIFLQDADGLVFRSVEEVRVTESTAVVEVRGVVHGEAFSHERHPGCLHVKAITRHDLAATAPSAGAPARARIILDI